MTAVQHTRALLVLILIISNLTFWCVPLFVIALLRLAQLNSILQLDRVAAHFYRLAVRFDDLCLTRVSRRSWISPELTLDKHQTCIVVSNHVSWVDVFLIQSVIAKKGPIIKFLMKKQLLYVPIFAAIAYAFKFPFVKRSKSGETDAARRREQDLARVKEACKVFRQSPAAMLVFPEGTRFSSAKHESQGQEYEHVLRPRPGGFSVLVDSLAEFDPVILNCTLFYPNDFTFWRFLGGVEGDIRLSVERIPENERRVLFSDPSEWLKNAWTRKDKQLESFRFQKD